MPTGEAERRILGYPGARAPGAFGVAHAALTERVLAYGSNAAPDVLARKLGAGARVHGMPAAVAGVDVVFSRHVSPYGAVPATVVPRPETVVEAFVLALDADGLRALAATEPNYTLEVLPTDPPVRAFVSRHGPLLDGGEPVALAAVPARGRTLPARTEAALLDELRARLAPELDLDAFVARLARERRFRDAVAARL